MKMVIIRFKYKNDHHPSKRFLNINKKLLILFSSFSYSFKKKEATSILF